MRPALPVAASTTPSWCDPLFFVADAAVIDGEEYRLWKAPLDGAAVRVLCLSEHPECQHWAVYVWRSVRYDASSHRLAVQKVARSGDAVAAVTVDDGGVTGWKRLLARGLWIAGGVALVGLGVFFAFTGLEPAGQWSGVIGAFVGLIGLGVSVYGVVLARRGSAAGQSGGQAVVGSTVGGEVLQLRGVRGNLRVGPPTTARAPAAPPGSAPPAPEPQPPGSAPPGSAPAGPGGQSVTDTHAAGPVRQFGDVGGDADIDR